MLDRLASPPGLAPIAFGVNSPQRVATLPQRRGELWSAHVQAVREGQFSKVFANGLFVESNDTAYVFGIEAPDARPAGLPADVADQQQLFIQFLREQTHEDTEVLWRSCSLCWHPWAVAVQLPWRSLSSPLRNQPFGIFKG